MNTLVKIQDLTDYLEALVPLSLQESYDNCGLITGSKSSQITNILVALDCTEEVVEEAILQGCNLIVAHHPIIFKGLKKINGNNYVERTIIKAIQSNIAIYAIHTNLDNKFDIGVNQKIGEKLSLKNIKPLAPIEGTLQKLVTFIPNNHLDQIRSALFDAGGGTIGNYDQCSFTVTGTGTFRGNEKSKPFIGEPNLLHHEPELRLEMIYPSYLQNRLIKALILSHPYEKPAFDIYALENNMPLIGAGLIGELPKPLEEQEFLAYLKKSLNLNTIRYTSYKETISKVALCGGSGSFLLKNALQADADAFITGDFKYHEFFDAENRLLIADIGHYESEFFTKELLKDLILKKFTTFAVLLSGINTNPIKYY